MENYGPLNRQQTEHIPRVPS